MDQIKIGKFIASCRKDQGMTQAALAEKLRISDRAVSKWETGKSLPDAGIMLELCEFLNINVNELLSGEKIMTEAYNKKAEEEMDLLVHFKVFNAETSEVEIPKFWDEYYANEEYRKIPGYLGVCAQEKTGGDEFKYGIGCKATDIDGIPEGFEVIHIPEYDWAVFKCVGPSPKAIQEMRERIYKEWLPVSYYELIPDVDIENYLPGDPSSPDYVSEICIPVKKK